MAADVDVVVVGAGHNGLVAANRLAERGGSVLVLEAEDEPGAAVKSGELTEPGFTSGKRTTGLEPATFGLGSRGTFRT